MQFCFPHGNQFSEEIDKQEKKNNAAKSKFW